MKASGLVAGAVDQRCFTAFKSRRVRGVCFGRRSVSQKRKAYHFGGFTDPNKEDLAQSH